MAVLTTTLPSFAAYAGLRQFTVAEYHQMNQIGILDEEDNVELLEGYVVLKMAKNPPHDGTIQRIRKRLPRYLSSDWDVRVQSAITLADSEPEPDLAVVRGDDSAFLTHHPSPADIGLIVEVSESTLQHDRDHKGRIYARAGIEYYWIINLVDGRVEAYTQPSGPTAHPAFGRRVDYVAGQSIPLVLAGVHVTLPVAELLP